MQMQLGRKHIRAYCKDNQRRKGKHYKDTSYRKAQKISQANSIRYAAISNA